MAISIDTLALAIDAVERDIAYHQTLAQDESLSDEDADYYSQYVLDLMRALSELSGLYECQKTPLLDELTNTHKSAA